MKYALALNFGILSTVLIVAWALSQPFALFGLLILKDMPWGLLVDEIKARAGLPTSQDAPEVNDYQGTGMGFIQDPDSEGGEQD